MKGEGQIVARLTITPNERLNPVERNALLCSILKFFLPGNWRMIRSTHIIEAVHRQRSALTMAARPRHDAVKRGRNPTSKSACCLRVSTVLVLYNYMIMQLPARKHTDTADRSHDPPSRIIVEHHDLPAGTFPRDDVVLPSSRLFFFNKLIRNSRVN